MEEFYLAKQAERSPELGKLKAENASLRSRLQAKAESQARTQREVESLQEQLALAKSEAQDRIQQLNKLMEAYQKSQGELSLAQAERNKLKLQGQYLQSELFDQRQKVLRNHMGGSGHDCRAC